MTKEQLISKWLEGDPYCLHGSSLKAQHGILSQYGFPFAKREEQDGVACVFIYTKLPDGKKFKDNLELVYSIVLKKGVSCAVRHSEMQSNKID